MNATDLDETVACLRRPETYPEGTRTVTPIQSHLSWVFLTNAFAYKLKKPVRYDSLDFSTLERRRRNCHEEVRLNRRLAPDVYLGVVAVRRAPDGLLTLHGGGEPVEWLVHMRRLPADQMLDAVIASGRAIEAEADIRTAARHLATFFRNARPEPISGAAYRRRLERGTQTDLTELLQPRYGLPRGRVEALAHAQLDVLGARGAMFDRRVQADRIIDGHGDLRPEHLCVRAEPAAIDCLEFARDLRLLDPADEMAFLSLECERLGEPVVGHWFLETYRDVTGDRPPPLLLEFYRVYRALRRATIAAWHLDDPSVPDPGRFLVQARRYLDLVEPVSAAGAQDGP